MAGTTGTKPTVLFVCEFNSARSQMAAAFLTRFAQGRVEVHSGGPHPADQVENSAVEAMAEVGVDISTRVPRLLTHDMVMASDVVITLGYADQEPNFPHLRHEDWPVEDPVGRDEATVRRIRDEIKGRVQQLITELLPRRHVDAQ
ncbi:low molecular weight phosphatase family protein [Arthrobacter zhaoguopingii]|uniref:arsenate-mycothiol transferase ArsC n=1 Tax=Arthrobacter zhaoguopingii TaxID=2681491 RepID=UPI001359ED1F|nr:arsenate reductase ArsC [Arthrobacter zhaoguopingii]